MPDEKELFQTTGRSWSERAVLGECDAVLTASGNVVRNVFLHNVQLVAANKALRWLPQKGRVVDFGCGTGRFVRFFAKHCHSVLGTEITKEMLEQARGFGIPQNSELTTTNGIHIPLPDAAVDLIWVCGVLRYSLNVPNPVYDRIAREMYRVLKPGARVVNVEMYVEQPPSDFTRDFEAAGFRTETVRIINRHNGHCEKFVQSGRLPGAVVPLSARSIALYRYHVNSADTLKSGLRDYVFVWKK
jgi:ubiquinone/menaquinone biosynthesis C-methylase UbiE